MRRIKELIDRRHARETITAVDEDAGVAREGRGIAGDRDHRGHGRCRQLARLRLGALPRRIEHHGVEPFELGRHQRAARQVTQLRRERLEPLRTRRGAP